MAEATFGGSATHSGTYIAGSSDYSNVTLDWGKGSDTYQDYSTGGFLGGSTPTPVEPTLCDWWTSEYVRNKEAQTRQQGLDAGALIVAAIATAMYLIFLNKYKDAQDTRDDIANKLVQIVCDLHDHWEQVTKVHIQTTMDDMLSQKLPQVDCDADLEQAQVWTAHVLSSELATAATAAKKRCVTPNECDNDLAGFSAQAAVVAARECTDNAERLVYQEYAQQVANINKVHRETFNNRSIATESLATAAGLMDTLVAEYASVLNSLGTMAGRLFTAGLGGE